MQQYRSDGFRDDTFLNRDDTNDRNELTARFKWLWEPSSQTRVELSLLRADIDNGYDAWSIDNTWRSQVGSAGRGFAARDRRVRANRLDRRAPATLTIIGAHASTRTA